MRSAWETLYEAVGDDDDLDALYNRAFGKNQSKVPSSGHSPFSTGLPDDTTDVATKDAGLNVSGNKTQQFQQSVKHTKAWLVASRYADQVLAIDDRKEMAELIQTFAAGMKHRRPLSPQLMGRYVGKLLLAHDEDQARQVLMDLVAELNGEKR